MSAALAPNDLLAGRYVLVRQLGQGADGVVFEAEDQHFCRRVALKTLASGPAIDLSAVERLKRDAEVANRLGHPNAVRVYDLALDAPRGVYFLVEELLLGQDLRVFLASRGPLAPYAAVRLLAPIVDVLAELHALGVIHRDVKPANIFVTNDRAGRPVPKLIDFGVARVLDATGPRTAAGVAVGTPAYMAPEVALGHPADVRADVWSIAAVLREAITGRPPRDAAPFPAAMPEDLAGVLRHAMAPDPAQRPRTMADLRDALLALGVPGLRSHRQEPDDAVEQVDIGRGTSAARRTVLIADDEEGARRVLRRALLDHEVVEARDGAEAIAAIQRRPFDLVITDLQMPLQSGVDVVNAAAEAGYPVIMVTGAGTTHTATAVMRLGAVNYLTKPFTLGALARAVTDVLTASELSGVRGEPMYGEHPTFLDVLERVERCADRDATVFITGETGTGKGALARFLHRLSPRRYRGFVAVEAGELTTASMERTLFGEVSNGVEHPGLVHEALGGTLFLDDVSRLPVECQWRLERFVESRTWAPVGVAQRRRADLRIIASAPIDLARTNAVSPALYHRLAVVPVTIPPLRERPTDIRALAQRFLARAERELCRGITVFDDEALDALCADPWPGNVRELHHFVTELAHRQTSGGPISRAVVARGRASGRPVAPGASMAPRISDPGFESDLILEALGEALLSGRELSALDRTILGELLRRRRGRG